MTDEDNNQSLSTELLPPSNRPPTSQRAELMAILLGLQQAIDKHRQLGPPPPYDDEMQQPLARSSVEFTIYSHSQFAIGSMSDLSAALSENRSIGSVRQTYFDFDLIDVIWQKL